MKTTIFRHFRYRYFRRKWSGNPLMHGWADDVVMPGPTIRYYEKLVAMAGGLDAAKKSARLFMVPGSYHCWRGPGADAIDTITALENGVERGQAPDRIVGYPPRTTSPTPIYLFPAAAQDAEFSRPYFPWPQMKRYSGEDDPKNADSFVV